MMITYEYQYESCGLKFERRQSITERPVESCPQCRGKVHQLISGGSAFIIKGGDQGTGCSYESSGTTCCGRQERCGKPPCGAGS